MRKKNDKDKTFKKEQKKKTKSTINLLRSVAR